MGDTVSLTNTLLMPFTSYLQWSVGSNLRISSNVSIRILVIFINRQMEKPLINTDGFSFILELMMQNGPNWLNLVLAWLCVEAMIIFYRIEYVSWRTFIASTDCEMNYYLTISDLMLCSLQKSLSNFVRVYNSRFQQIKTRNWTAPL